MPLFWPFYPDIDLENIAAWEVVIALPFILSVVYMFWFFLREILFDTSKDDKYNMYRRR